MKKFPTLNFKISVVILMIVLLILPAMSSVSAQGLVNCGKTIEDPCEFDDVVTLIHNLMNFILINLSIPIAAIMFVYAGFLMLVPGGESGSKRSKAKNIFTNAVLGLLLVVGAWLIVNTLLSILGYDGSWILDR